MSLEEISNETLKQIRLGDAELFAEGVSGKVIVVRYHPNLNDDYDEIVGVFSSRNSAVKGVQKFRSDHWMDDKIAGGKGDNAFFYGIFPADAPVDDFHVTQWRILTLN